MNRVRWEFIFPRKHETFSNLPGIYQAEIFAWRMYSVNHSNTSSLIWKGVSATLWSGRYTLSYPRRSFYFKPLKVLHRLFFVSFNISARPARLCIIRESGEFPSSLSRVEWRRGDVELTWRWGNKGYRWWSTHVRICVWCLCVMSLWGLCEVSPTWLKQNLKLEVSATVCTHTITCDIPLDGPIYDLASINQVENRFLRINNISVTISHAQLMFRTVIKKIWGFFRP